MDIVKSVVKTWIKEHAFEHFEPDTDDIEKVVRYKAALKFSSNSKNYLYTKKYSQYEKKRKQLNYIFGGKKY